MNHKRILEKMDQCSAQIDKLFWIATSLDYSGLKEIIEEMLDEEHVEQVFPEIYNSPFYSEYSTNWESFKEALIDTNTFGFLASVLFPVNSNFSFDERGRVQSSSSSFGHCHIAYIYAETLGELITLIERKSRNFLNMDIQIAKQKGK